MSKEIDDLEEQHEEAMASELKEHFVEVIRREVAAQMKASFDGAIAQLKAQNHQLGLQNSELREQLIEFRNKPWPELKAMFKMDQAPAPVVNVTIPQGAIRVVCEHGDINVPKDAIKVIVQQSPVAEVKPTKAKAKEIVFKHDKDGRIVGATIPGEK